MIEHSRGRREPLGTPVSRRGLGSGRGLAAASGTIVQLIANQVMDAEKTLSEQEQDTEEVKKAWQILEPIISGLGTFSSRATTSTSSILEAAQSR